MCLYSTKCNSTLLAQQPKNPRRCPAAPPQSINKQKRKRSHDCSQKHNFQHKVLLKGRKYLGCGNLGPSEPCQPGCKGFTLAQCENMTLGQLQGRAGLETDWLSLLRVFLPRCTSLPQCKDTSWFLGGQVLFFLPQKWTHFIPIPVESMSMSFQSQK